MHFCTGLAPENAFTHTAIADAFVCAQGFSAIRFNWELLDAGALPPASRSAFGEISTALSGKLSNPNTPWLERGEAEQCAGDFLKLFDPQYCTIVSNRYDGLWHPISGAGVEWGFVGFDNGFAALLLLCE